MNPASVNFLGVKVTLLGREEIKEYLVQSIYNKERFRLLFLDEHKMFTSFFRNDFKKLINESELVICSSQTVSWMIKVLTGKTVSVIMPVTVFLDYMVVADEMNYTVFLFGGKKLEAFERLKRIKKSFSQARIVGNYQSNIKNNEMLNVMTTIRKSSPQIFFASYLTGAKQEMWLSENMSYFQNSIIVGVDNAFRIIVGKKKMPPLWFQKREWNGFYTFLTHPYNLLRNFRLVSLFFITLIYKIRNK